MDSSLIINASCVVKHNSLYIYPDRRGWHCNSQDKCGSSVIDYCQKMKGMSFPDTIKMFLGEKTIDIQKASIMLRKKRH